MLHGRILSRSNLPFWLRKGDGYIFVVAVIVLLNRHIVSNKKTRHIGFMDFMNFIDLYSHAIWRIEKKNEKKEKEKKKKLKKKMQIFQNWN